jgi:ABC-type transport system substrate-binding protein
MRNGFWGRPATGPIPPDIAGWVDERSPYAGKDIERAKKLLAEAGYPGGKGLPVLSYELNGVDATNRHGAEIMKAGLAEIGIEMQMNGQTWDQFIVKVKKRQAQMFGMAWNGDYPDAQNFLQLFYSQSASPGPNNANYSNPEFDALYDRMKVMPPSPVRDELIREMVRIVNEDCPWTYSDHRVKYSYAQPWLRNYKYLGLQPWMFKYYRIDTAEKAKRLAAPR